MRVSVTVTDPQHRDGEPVRELSRWLSEKDELRNRVRLIEDRRQTGALAETALTLVTELGGPALAAFGAALVTWLRHRTANTRVLLRRSDGARFEITAQRVRGLSQTEIKALVDQLSSILDDRRTES